MSEPVKLTGDVKKNFVHERYLQSFFASHTHSFCKVLLWKVE